MTPTTQAAARWFASVAGVVHVFEVLGDLLPEQEGDALLDRLERLGEAAIPSSDTWSTLTTIMRSLRLAAEAVGHPVVPLLHSWESDLMRQRDRAAQPPEARGAREAGSWDC